MVELLLPKQVTRVRFPSPAPAPAIELAELTMPAIGNVCIMQKNEDGASPVAPGDIRI